jgi:Secretion system C-terminal sorting domain/Beta-propeller repeat
MKKILILLTLMPCLLSAQVPDYRFEENKGQFSGALDSTIKYVLRTGKQFYCFTKDGYTVQLRGKHTMSLIDFGFVKSDSVSYLEVNNAKEHIRYYKPWGVFEVQTFTELRYVFADQSILKIGFTSDGYLRKTYSTTNASGDFGIYGHQRADLTDFSFELDTVTKSHDNYFTPHEMFFVAEAGELSEKVIASSGTVSMHANDKQFFYMMHHPESSQSIVSIDWLTYLGGTGSDELFGITNTPDGGVIVAGRSSSTDFPVTVNAVQDTFAGTYDIVVSSFDSVGNCRWSTYYGGTNFEGAYGVLMLDTLAVVYGNTLSTDLPMFNAFQDTSAGTYEAFVAMFDTSGAIVRSTYFGGMNADQGFAMAVDTSGNLVLAGSTLSPNLPMSAGSYQPVPAGQIDAFISVLTPLLQPLWTTCYGGTGSEDVHAITVTPQGEIAFCGGSFSSNFPTTVNAFQTSTATPSDIYLVKFGMNGSRHYATLFGGTSNEDANGMVCDSMGNIYITGYTYSFDFPIMGNSFQTIHDAQNDAFVTKFDSTGQPVWSTYIGGNGAESGIAMYRLGKHLFISGNTESTDFPVSPNGLQPVYAGLSDGFVIKMDTTGTMVSGTYHGGSSIDAIYGIAVTADDTSVVACGNTYSNDLNSTFGAYQLVNNGSGEGYVFKFGMSEQLNPNGSIEMIDASTETVLLYPNPAKDWLYIETTSGNSIREVKVYDLTGRMVLTGSSNSGMLFQLNMSNLPEGTYIVKLDTEKGIEEKKLVIAGR